MNGPKSNVATTASFCVIVLINVTGGGGGDGDGLLDGDKLALGDTEGLTLRLTDADGDTDGLTLLDGLTLALADDTPSYSTAIMAIVLLVPNVNTLGPAHVSLVVVTMRDCAYHDTAAALLRDRLSKCSV